MSLELPDRASVDSTSTGLQADDFNGFFVHLLILHGLGECRLSGRLRDSQSAFLIALLACVPVGLSAWRQYRKKDAEVSQGPEMRHG